MPDLVDPNWYEYTYPEERCPAVQEAGIHDWDDVLEGPVTVDRVCLACDLRASDEQD